MAHHIPDDQEEPPKYTPNQWDLTCAVCFKRISASRPPVFNADNCCCVDLCGIEHDATGSTSSSDAGSDTSSVEVGQSRTDTYLEIGPRPGLNEIKNRRASLSLLSYPMQAFLKENDLQRWCGVQQSKYLVMKLHIVWQVGKKISESIESGSDVYKGFEGLEGNIWAGMGAWAEDKDMDGRQSDELSLSGIDTTLTYVGLQSART